MAVSFLIGEWRVRRKKGMRFAAENVNAFII